jgi:LysR family hydrogen peroxide-inducible transcriptional activator
MHQLRYFVAVAQTGNFSRAAERCHVSQPSLSQQILKLERKLGQPLFQRLGRKVLLTDAGHLLLDRATAILATADDAERRLRSGDEAHGGRLAVGAIPTIAPYFLPQALERFMRPRSNVELNVREDVTSNLVQALVEGELDLAVAALPIADERLDAAPLFTEPLLLAVPPRHILAKQRRIGLRDLAAERFILLHELHCLGEQVLSFCRAHDCHPQVACRSAQISTIQALISLGQGVSLLPRMACRADRSKTLVYRPLHQSQPHRTVAVIWHRHHYHSPLAERFLAELRQAAGKHSLLEANR